MVSEWDRAARFGDRAWLVEPATPSALSRLFGLICFWRVGEDRRLAAEPIGDHLLRDIGLSRADFNLMARVPRRRP
jgi:uncharacterized protein YjiS (DUF1127 family)